MPGPREWTPIPKGWDGIEIGPGGYLGIIVDGRYKPFGGLSEKQEQLPANNKLIAKMLKVWKELQAKHDEAWDWSGPAFPAWGWVNFNDREVGFSIGINLFGKYRTVREARVVARQFMAELKEAGLEVRAEDRGNFNVGVQSIADFERVRATILSVARKIGLYDKLPRKLGDIGMGIVDTFHVETWLAEEREKGRRFPPGTNLLNVSPKIPSRAYEAAENFISKLEQWNGRTLDELYWGVLSTMRLIDSEELRKAVGRYLALDALGEIGVFEEAFPNQGIKIPNISYA